jgi:hypothetical protein
MNRLTRALSIPGWMSPGELAWLESQAKTAALAIELGSWRGRSSVALTAADSLVCVDKFFDQAQETGTGQDLLPFFLESTLPFRDKVTAIRGDISSEEFSESLVSQYGGKADLVFVDASHDEASVRRDIALARRLGSPSAVICGHDFSPAWPGVMAAVTSLVPGFSVAADSVWWRVNETFDTDSHSI